MEFFEQLRTLRTEIARQEGMPPYIIFSDKTLVDMCIRLPLTKEEMLAVSGVGENKFVKYGERFLEEIRRLTGGTKEKFYFGTLEEVEQLRGGTGKQKRKDWQKIEKTDFFVTGVQAGKFPYEEKYLAPELAERLNELREGEQVKKTSGAEIFRRIQELGLAGERYENGRRQKYVTEAGKEAGLWLGSRTSKAGTEYQDIYYDKKAQRMVVEWFVRGTQ